MFTKDYKFLIKAFLIWLVALFAILFLAVKFIPLQKNFLGGGYSNYVTSPYLWAWGNFDGEHYVSIAKNGYGFGEYAFFPLYPVLIKVFGNGIFVSITSFFIGLIGLFKLLKFDFSEKFAKTVIIFLLIFPTSYYFASVYTESLFFALAVWALYWARRGNFLLATILGIFLTATRFIGIIILPVVWIEWFLESRGKNNFLKSFPEITLAIPTGLFAYMYYLEGKTHDMFAFFTSLTSFGEQRSSHLITLPQVFYRYFFKIIPSLNFNYFPVTFVTFLEIVVSLIFLLMIFLSFRKLRFSYWTFLTLGYLIPTFSGSFSSLPRYVLILFPAYIFFAKLAGKRRFYFFAFGAVSFILLIISFGLFARGYWIS